MPTTPHRQEHVEPYEMDGMPAPSLSNFFFYGIPFRQSIRREDGHEELGVEVQGLGPWLVEGGFLLYQVPDADSVQLTIRVGLVVAAPPALGCRGCVAW